MPVLDNPMHEVFSQLLAKGVRQGVAYAQAGYKPNEGNASYLKGQQNIQDRVKELLERSANRTEVTIASVLDELEEARSLANIIAQPAAMTQATMGKAKIKGLIIERREIGDPGDFDAMTEAELIAALEKRSSTLGLSEEARKLMQHSDTEH